VVNSNRFNMAHMGGSTRFSVYVGNIPYQTTEDDLGHFFSQAGQVTNVRLVIDRETGRPKGFGFCEFADEQSAQNAISQFNGVDFNGRSLRVNMANR
ncbi:hypothetical protein PFISCL1PPCAC_20384, partial [Pristionchus fissidentatus]